MMAAAAQPSTDVYAFLRSLLTDSTGYENVGDWGVGNPKKFAVKWQTDGVKMSNDTSINFYRQGTANLTINGKTCISNGKPMTWNVLFKGPRMGYSSFSILTSPSAALSPRFTIDSLFGKNRFSARLLKACEVLPFTGFYYYELKLPKKDVVYLKLTWLTANGNTALRLDGYDSWSRYAARLECKTK